MKCKQGLVPVAKALADLGGRVKALRTSSAPLRP